MVRFKKTLTLAILLLFAVNSEGFSQQLPQFSQYMFNGLHINPAYAGYKNEGYVQATFRNQWVNFPGAPQTLSVSADLSANDGKMGFGISLLSDKIGPTESKIGLLTYAYRIRVKDKGFLGLGVSTGFSDYMLDPSLFRMNDQNDPLIPGGIVRKIAPNLNSGLFYNTDKFYAGLSVFNMIGKAALKSEDVAIAYHDFHYFFTVGALFDLSDEVKFKPSGLIKHTKGSPTSYDVNAMFLLGKKIWIGAAYRSNARVFEDNLQERSLLNNRTAFMGLFELFVTNNVRLGYSYDHNMNALSSQVARNGSHEFSIGYYLRPSTTIMKNPRWF